MKALALLSFSLLLPVFASAETKTISCEIQGAARCLCPASLIVKCSDNRAGYIANDVKPLSVTLILGPKKIVIENPKSSVREFYTPEYVAEVKKLLKGEDLERVFTDSFEVPADTRIYDNSNMEESES